MAVVAYMAVCNPNRLLAGFGRLSLGFQPKAARPRRRTFIGTFIFEIRLKIGVCPALTELCHFSPSPQDVALGWYV
jgi:hypothetical protein